MPTREDRHRADRADADRIKAAARELRDRLGRDQYKGLPPSYRDLLYAIAGLLDVIERAVATGDLAPKDQIRRAGLAIAARLDGGARPTRG
ncbi:MAG: hypothetical protein ACRDT0_06215 [Pseudonocardiaceae bacterium]